MHRAAEPARRGRRRELCNVRHCSAPIRRESAQQRICRRFYGSAVHYPLALSGARMRHGARVEEDALHGHHARRHGVAAVRLVACLYPALRAARVDHLPPAAPEPEPLQSLGRHPDAVDLVRAAQRNVSLRHPRKAGRGQPSLGARPRRIGRRHPARYCPAAHSARDARVPAALVRPLACGLRHAHHHRRALQHAGRGHLFASRWILGP